MHLSKPIDVTAHSQVIVSTEEPPALITTTPINQMSNTYGVLFVFFLFFSYICAGVWYKKKQEARLLALQEQIKTLEKIWNMSGFER
ncbi:MAG TPA: hypothetical protein DCP31_14620 [Cyanobacteria bacterium UBA8543]|nr:hypothetical protein [Cyanobacteria bacterium UBA8543]